MEPFLQLPGLTIQKIIKDKDTESKEESETPGPASEGELSEEDSVGNRDEVESEVEDEFESDESDEEEDSKVLAKVDDKSGEEQVKDEVGEGEEKKEACAEEKPDADGEIEPKVEASVEEKKEESFTPVNKRKKRKKNESEKGGVKRKRRKKRSKGQKKDEDTDSEEEEAARKEKRKKVKNLRKNIREVMNENELDEETKAAQREEMERLSRVQEQQKMLKEMQRKIMMEKQKNLLQSLGQSPSILKNCTFTPMSVNKDLFSNLSANAEPGFTEFSTTPGGASVSLANRNLECKKDEFSDLEMDHEESLMGQQEIGAGVPEAPKKSALPKELVTISSSDDDCMIVSGGSGDESQPEDPTNSGLHTNDVFNIPDEQGRVLINVGHPETEPDIFLAPQIARVIKPHQIGGIRFLFDNVVESLDRYKTSTGFGCILAHSMGLGKTLQVVSFCDIFLRNTSARHILCIMPINTLQNWLAEFNMWMPTEATVNGSEEQDPTIRPRNFKLFVLNDAQKTLTARAKVIRQWRLEGGALLIGYELFRLLSLRRDKNSKKKKFVSLVDIEEDDNRKKALWNEIHDALVKPGPDLVICDEGHRIKNSHASISHALKSMQTKRRVVLTGYPLQNNLLEYWCMVDFVRPNYLGTKTEFCNMFERPIQNGQCVDSTPNDTKVMRYRAHVLHSLLNGFVQRRSHDVLQSALPQKNEFVLLFRMTPFQRKLYSCFMNDVVRTKAVPNPLKAFSVCCKIWNHPDVLYYFLKKRMEGDDLDLEDPVLTNPVGTLAAATPPKNAKGRSKKTTKLAIAEASGDQKADATVQSQESTNSQSQDFQNNCQGFSQNYNNFGEYSGQFNQQYQQNFFNNMQQQSYQSSNQYSNQPNAPFNLPSSQNYGQQNWPQSCYDQNQADYKDESFPLLPTTLEQKEQVPVSKNDRLLDLMNKKVENFDNKEIESIEKMIDEKIEGKKDEEVKGLLESGSNMPKSGRDETSIPYDWATEILKGYEPGKLENSAKMEALFCILEESSKVGDRILVFSQSLFTLNLIEDFLHQNTVPGTDEKWAKNTNYFRLDGSTAAIEREKLINEFNSNPKFQLFLVSTRAGSLGINLVGANRVIVFDASWNPCHDTQAVCRVYRYGQIKPCFVYRFVMDNCLEKKIYDRQINKQGMADRVVDELNPDAHLSMKEVSNLLYDSEPETEPQDHSDKASKFEDKILKTLLEKHSLHLSKIPFQHQSLLKDRKDKKLSQAEKRLAKRSYELEKQAATRPGFNNYYGGYQGSYSTSGGGIINSAPPSVPIRQGTRPVASVRPIQASRPPVSTRTRWIPAETWQRQGMNVQEMVLPIDVVIPTNSPDRSISLKMGQRVMVLKSSKGVYMQLDNGKIIAIRGGSSQKGDVGRSTDPSSSGVDPFKGLLPLNSELTITPRAGAQTVQPRSFPTLARLPSVIPELDPNSSNSGSSSSSMHPIMPFDNNVSAMDMLSSLHDSLTHTKSPTHRRSHPTDNAFSVPATTMRKPAGSNFPLPPFSAHEDPQSSFATAGALRSSGGGIVSERSLQASAYPNYNPNYVQQPSYPGSYGAFHRPEFNPSGPANNQYMPPFGQNPPAYYAQDSYQSAPPYHESDGYAYQENFNPHVYSNSQQSSHQYSHPPS